MTLDKLASAAGKLHTFFKVLQKITGICMIAVLCVMTVITAVHIINPDAVIGENTNTVDLGPITVNLAEENAFTNREMLTTAWIAVVFGLACAAVVYAAFGIVRKILLPMTEGQPFHPDTARYFKKLAVLSLVFGIVQNIAAAAEIAGTIRMLKQHAVATDHIITSISANYTVDLTFLVVFFILLLMSYLFAYGSTLQQLSDETL